MHKVFFLTLSESGFFFWFWLLLLFFFFFFDPSSSILCEAFLANGIDTLSFECFLFILVCGRIKKSSSSDGARAPKQAVDEHRRGALCNCSVRLLSAVIN